MANVTLNLPEPFIKPVYAVSSVHGYVIVVRNIDNVIFDRGLCVFTSVDFAERYINDLTSDADESKELHFDLVPLYGQYHLWCVLSVSECECIAVDPSIDDINADKAWSFDFLTNEEGEIDWFAGYISDFVANDEAHEAYLREDNGITVKRSGALISPISQRRPIHLAQRPIQWTGTDVAAAAAAKSAAG